MREMNRFCDFYLRRVLVRTGVPALVFLLSICTLPAQFMVRQTNLAYLARRADVIVQGRITKVSRESLPQYPNVQTVVVTLKVEDMVRGPAGSTYTFREILLDARSKEGKQGYAVGQQVFLFLPLPSSQYGLSSPVGIGQGRFHIARDSAGSGIVVNEHGNAGLFKNVEQDATKGGMRLSRSQMRLAATRSGPVSLDEFTALVRSLTKLPRIK